METATTIGHPTIDPTIALDRTMASNNNITITTSRAVSTEATGATVVIISNNKMEVAMPEETDERAAVADTDTRNRIIKKCDSPGPSKLAMPCKQCCVSWPCGNMTRYILENNTLLSMHCV